MENRAIKKLYSMDEAGQDAVSEKIAEVVSDSPVVEAVQDRVLIEKIEDGVALVTDVESGDQAIADMTGEEVVFTELDTEKKEFSKKNFCAKGESCKYDDQDCIVDSDIDEDGNVTIKIGEESQVVKAEKLVFSHGMTSISEDNELVKLFIKLYKPAKEILDKFIKELQETAANLPKGGNSGKMFSENEEEETEEAKLAREEAEKAKAASEEETEEAKLAREEAEAAEAEAKKKDKESEEETEEAKAAREEAEAKAASEDEITKAKVDPSKDEDDELDEKGEKKTFSASSAQSTAGSRIGRFIG